MTFSKDKSAQTTGKIVSVSYRLWLHLLTKSVLNPTKLRGVIYDQSVDSSCFTLWELTSTARIKWRSQFIQFTYIYMLYIHMYIKYCKYCMYVYLFIIFLYIYIHYIYDNWVDIYINILHIYIYILHIYHIYLYIS